MYNNINSTTTKITPTPVQAKPITGAEEIKIDAFITS